MWEPRLKPRPFRLPGWGKQAQRVDLRFALHGGEDYELLFTAPAEKKVPARIAGVAVRQIGVVTRGRRVFLRNKKGVREEFLPQGWEHFKKAQTT